ncbi:MAG: 50S ribosomal protein L25 [Spirochaetes bacterium]|nr:50S ribosomal protein L25 [Spirochaetota bacterium]
MEERVLNVETRTEFGKNESNRLRQSGFIPAVLYSHGNSKNLKVPAKAFGSIFKGHISESVLIDLNITDTKEDPKHQAFVKDYLADPVTGQILHLDFYKITAGEKIHTIVPLEIEGTPKGVKAGGVLEIMERELEIECLPKDLPEHISVDISNLDIGDSFHIKDFNLGGSIKFLATDDKVIAAVITPHVNEEEEGGEEAAPAEKAEAEDGEEAK